MKLSNKRNFTNLLIKFGPFVLISLGVLLYMNFTLLNFVVRTQIVYFLVPLLFGYLFRNIISALLYKRSDLYKGLLYLSVLDITSIYDDFVSYTKRIFSLRLNKGFSIVFVVIYVVLLSAIAVLNGGIEKASVKLLISSVPFISLFLFHLDPITQKLSKVLNTIAMSGFILVGYFVWLQGFVFILDLVLLFLGLWTVFFGLVYPREKIYSLAIMFIVGIPAFLLMGNEIYANFVANCSYLLLLLGVFKDLFYDLVFKINDKR